ncbi:MAG TPA: glycosyltransferase family 39 protein [Planctomycetota bacterium]|nr:glycosyltransferase family 39 protein [Planctomycetota bacterium]
MTNPEPESGPLAPADQQLKVWLLVAAITLAGLGLRTYRLSYQVLDCDEYATVMFAQEPVSRILGPEYKAETNPPLYYLLQHAWLPFGRSREALRSLPLLFGMLVIPLTFILGKKLAGTWEGVVACALVASADAHVFYSREIRCYSLLTAASLGALICLAGILSSRGVLGSADGSGNPPSPPGGSDAGPAAGTKSRRYWWGYFGCTSIVLHAHSTGVLLPFLASLLVLGLVLLKRARPELLWRWVAVNLVLLGVYLPVMLVSLEQTQTVLTHWWVPKSTGSWVRIQIMSSYPFYKWFKPVLYTLPLVGAWLLRRRPVGLVFFLVFIVGEPLMLYLVSLYRPVFLTSAIIWPTILTFILMAVAIVRLRPRLGARAVVIATALVVAAQLVTVRNYYPAKPEVGDAEGFIEPLRGFRKAGDVFVVAPQQIAWVLWYDTHELPLPKQGFGVTFADARPQLYAWYGVPLVPRDQIPGSLKNINRVWLVRELKPLYPPGPGEGFEGVLSRLEGWGSREGSWRSGNLELDLYQRGSGDHR